MFTTQHSKANTQVAAAPVRAHVEALINAGLPPSMIARLAGLDVRRVRVLLDDTRTERGTTRLDDTGRGERRTLKRIADALLAVPIPDAMFVSATGPVRRLRALVRIGHSFADLAPAVGFEPAFLAEVALGVDEVIDGELAATLVDVFDRYCLTPGTDDEARELGRRHRWAAPLAWSIDEEDEAGSIDDPLAEPVGLPPTARRAVPADFAEIVADHRELGHYDEEIAESLGLSLATFSKRLQRAKIAERARGTGESYTRPALYGARYAIRLPWAVVA